MPKLCFRAVQGYLLSEHPTPGGRIFQILTIKKLNSGLGEGQSPGSRIRNSECGKVSALVHRLSAVKHNGSAGSAACVPIAPVCCTPVGSPDVPYRRDILSPRDTDMAAGSAAGAARR